MPNGRELTEILANIHRSIIKTYLSQLSTVWNVLRLVRKIDSILPAGRRPSYPRVIRLSIRGITSHGYGQNLSRVIYPDVESGAFDPRIGDPPTRGSNA